MSTQSTSSSSPSSSASAQRKGWKLPAAAAAILAVSAGLFGLHGFDAKADDAPASAQPAATPVSVATVAESEVTAWDEFSGRLEAVERVDIRSRVAGAVPLDRIEAGLSVELSRALFESAIEALLEQVPQLKATWINGGDTAALISGLQRLGASVWAVQLEPRQPLRFQLVPEPAA